MAKPLSDKPNILLILTDQQSAHMMSCAGNAHLRTPAMDSLAARGRRFGRAYCTDPVCVPSRFSLMTGRMPGEIGLRSNSSRHIEEIPATILESAAGWPLREAGYDTAYAGKVHLPKGTTAEQIGFTYITSDERDECAEVCADYLLREHARPFFLVASFINPHDICYMAIRDSRQTNMEQRLVGKGRREIEALDRALRLPEGIDEEEFFAGHCPPLPPNFEPQEDEPEAIQRLIEQRPFRLNARRTWTERRWRLHRLAYARLTERVDGQIGRLLEALGKSGREDDTLVIFTSDHGDMDSSHRMEHKTAFYEEACRVPLVVAGPGIGPGADGDDEHLVSNGLDLLPTLCDYAGIQRPEAPFGRSIRPFLEGRTNGPWRTHLPIESEIGRMVVTERFKYMLYDEGRAREQLMDLRADPHEMRNAAADPHLLDVLADHRRLFRDIWPDVPGPA